MEENITQEKSMSKADLINVMKFANQIYSSGMFGVFTPQLSNQIMIDVNNNPLIPTREGVKEALKNYKYSADELQAYSEFMEMFNNLYSRTIEYYANMLSFDFNLSCTNAYSPETEYKSKAYKDDKRRIYKFLDNFDYVAEFQRVLKDMIRKEVVFTWFRDTQGTFDDEAIELIDGEETKVKKPKKMSKYTIQTMPQTYCLLTSRWERGFLYDVNMNYFLRAGVDISSYDPVFKSYFNNTFNSDGKSKYIPNQQLDSRDGSFALWHQTSPNDGAWVWKFDDSNANTTPFLSSLIDNCLMDDEIKKLQLDKNMLEAHAILVGEIQMMDKQQSGQQEDAMSFNPETLMRFLQLAKLGLDTNVNATAMPTKDPRLVQYNNNNNTMYDIQLKQTAGQGASASRMIYSNDKMSSTETICAITTDYNLMKRVYSQFNEFMNFFANRKTKRYKFNFEFNGSNYPLLREYENKNLMSLADKGFVLNTSAYAKIVNMKPHSFERSLEEGHYSDLSDKLTLLLNVNTTKGGEDGTQEKDSTEISDDGVTNQEYK